MGFSLNPSTFCNYDSGVQSSYFWIAAPRGKSAAAGDVDEVKCPITLHIFIKQWVERQHNWEALSCLWWMLSNIAVFCPAMTESIRVTHISAVSPLDLYSPGKRSLSSPPGKDCRRARPSTMGLGCWSIHGRCWQDFSALFSLWAFLFYSCGRSRRPWQLVYLFFFLNLAQWGSALGLEMRVLLNINNNQIGV